jgi:hypothetical protein
MLSEQQAASLENALRENTEAINKSTNSVTDDGKSKIRETITAILLSIATIASAWCAYQSTLWGGEQTFQLADANRTGRLAAENAMLSTNIRSFEGFFLIKYIEASKNGDSALSNFYYSRFQPVLQKATDDWLKTDPFNNPNAPRSPFQMESYKLEADQKAQDLRIQSTNFMDKAQQSNKNSDTYVLLTVLFASVLFFGGISASFESQKVKTFAIGLAIVLFMSTFIMLLRMPVASL